MAKLGLSDLIGKADDRVVGRGRALFRSGAVERATRAGDPYAARVEGSAPYPYRASIDLVRGQWACTCPYEFGPVCKHVVALALAALEAPEVFEARARPKSRRKPANLEALSEDEALDLLRRLEEAHPEVVREFAYNLLQDEEGW